VAILVTGAAGFIGSHVAARLLRRGDDVIGLDNFDPYYSPDRKRLNVREVAREATRPGQFELVDGWPACEPRWKTRGAITTST
jgi:nucleoside-diphosphate-sugar epimerase